MSFAVKELKTQNDPKVQNVSKHLAQDPLIVRLLQTVTQLDPDRIDQLYQSPLNDGESFEQSLIESGLVDERQIAEAYAGHYLLPLFDPPLDSPPPIAPSMADVLPQALCRLNNVVPLSDDGQTIEVALFSPDALMLADEVRELTGRQMRPLFTTLGVIERLQRVLYDRGTWANKADSDVTIAGAAYPKPTPSGEPIACRTLSLTKPLPAGRDGRVMSVINSFFARLLNTGATEIHIEPGQKQCRVRERVNGQLSVLEPVPKDLVEAVTKRLRTLSGIAQEKTTKPQDGAITVCGANDRVHARVCSCQTQHGQRLLLQTVRRSKQNGMWPVAELDQQRSTLLTEALEQAQGWILFAGSTGSQNEETLRQTLAHCAGPQTSSCLIEHTASTAIEDACHLQIDPLRGTDCKTMIEAAMRQSCDRIATTTELDKDAIKACTRAALTGRMVMSSIDAPDAISAINKVRDLSPDPFLLSRSLTLTVAQRSVRRLCDACKIPRRIHESAAKQLSLDPDKIVFHADGCGRCCQSGFLGTTLAYEVVRMGTVMSGLVRAASSSRAMMEAARRDGCRLMQESLVQKVLSGETSPEEVIVLLQKN